ncbi:LOW QUALITY PROTEIN: protein cordon-bleu [Plectropomus leopardus]|uniref:LOW QUALITY PROTEIN: protein cordon-bleu n=1 Tax=Plectropomus leopardus TaxID=160734 RepID=UPI001C4DB3CA|nr:LOW QUALITY PROTEIN: protein cordon-bleu [Plectropomus leopardus]
MTESSKPPSGRRMKARAPPPPQAPLPAPRHIFRNTVPDGGGTSGIDTKENVLRPAVDLQLTLPQGYQTSVTEDGSKALMDLLVELCSRYHLNPALHTLELLSPEGHNLGFKPNALLGSLNVACVLIKEKVLEEKVVRRPAPKVPEKTVRLMVNYHGSQKAVVRVNPFVPLQALIPVICDKCEFDPAHVLLLKDSISRHELPLNKSLTDLGIKELYVHDQSLVLQPKMASAPALNYSDSLRSSTTSLGRAEKKGLLGIFQFSRRKTKKETTSLGMDDCDDKVTQNTDTQSNGLSTASGVPSVEDRPSTLGQSQSAMNINRMSPKAETKKRRAPALPGAPTPTVGHTSFEGYQMGLGSESQQRKRKAPAPPPTPDSITPGLSHTSTSAAPTPDSHVTETPTPAFRSKVAPSDTVPATIVVMQTVKPVPSKTAVQPPPVCAATPTANSPTPSSSTTDSLAVQDSSSDLSHGLDDSDADLDQAVSYCSTLTSSTASGSVPVQPATKSFSSRVEGSEKASSTAAKLNQEATSTSSSRSETESAINLKLDEVENNRHSTMGTADRPVPPKPRRSPAQEPPQLVSPPTLPPPPIEPTESSSLQSLTEVEEAAPQSWLHSMQSSTASCPKPETATPEEETASLGSSSGGSSLPDQGYAASEGMAEGEDSGMVSSPSDTQPTSPDGSLSLDGSSGGGAERMLGPVRDNSSDSDEGCATWGSRHRHDDISPQAKPGRLKDQYEDDPELTAQLHQTLADFEADLADHIDLVSAKETPYTMSTDSNDVPVSVVDMDVPVTAIDEVLEDYEHHIVQHETKSLIRTESAGSKGPGLCDQSSLEPQNKNNNACTAADTNKSISTNTKSQPEQHRKSQENKSKSDKKEDKMLETKIKKASITDTNSVKEDKQKATSAAKSSVDMQKFSKRTEIKPEPVKSNAQSFQEKKTTSQSAVSSERNEEMNRLYQNNSSQNTSHGKITRNVTSRFGMKTFTVVPPKPSVLHAATEEPSVKLTIGAIKIDDQGNMVKGVISQNRVGGSSESGVKSSEGSPLLGKAKAFWSSNERQENSVLHSKDHIDKAKERTDGPKSTPTVVSATTLKSSDTENLKTVQTLFDKHVEKAQPKDMVKEEKEPARAVNVAKEEQIEVESKIPVSETIQQPSNKPALPPPILPDLKRDLSFLKPSRRTSSQYVASAINKYTPKTSFKPNLTPNVHESSAPIGFQRSGRSIKVNPHQSSQSSLSDNKENDSASKSNPPGPKRSMSFPEYVSDVQRDFGEMRPDRGGFGSCVGFTKGSSNTLEKETAKNKHIQSNGPTQKNAIANNDSDHIKHIQLSSPSPAQSSPPHSSAKPPTAPKTVCQDQTSNTKDLTKDATHLTPDAEPQPSVTVTDTGVTPGPPPVTLFGPVKKFRPVISRSVEKDTSLHGSLMEAIQTGAGRDRLKKITTSEPRNMKKASYVDEENERSALLAAIRAQSSSGRLRKTKSWAADELEKFRKVALEEERGASTPSSPSSPSLTCTSPPVFTPPPPPPPAPVIAPPPPPPALPQGKPSTVTYPSANAPVNPALAREAMLEAIRSGSAAERLKKVAVPTKTVQVNGRLGTIQATSSTLPQQ